MCPKSLTALARLAPVANYSLFVDSNNPNTQATETRNHRVLRKRSCSAPSRDFVCSQSHLHCHLNHFQTSSNIVITIQRAQRHPKYLLHHSTTVHYSSLQFTTAPLRKNESQHVTMSQVHHSSHPRHCLSIKKDGSSGRSRRTAVTRA